MSKKIKIDVDLITPSNPPDPTSDGFDLINCYFQLDGSTLNFYKPGNPNALNSGPITLNNAFTAQVDGHNFSITPTQFTSSVTGISGSWNDLNGTAEPGSGTFQAQAGVTVDEDAASSASA